MDQMKPFKTSDLGIAAYLLSQGMDLLGCIESGEAGRLFFIFEDSVNRDTFIEDWTSGKDEVSASHYFRCLRVCKKRLQEPVA